MKRIGFLLAAIAIIGGFLYLAQNRPAPAASTSSFVPVAESSAPTRLVTMDGNDGAGGIIDPINIWDNYQTRSGVVAKVHPGDKVTLVRQDGNGVLIQTSAGTQGWVSAQFIKELR